MVELWLGDLRAPPAAKIVAAVLTTLPLACRTAAPVAAVGLTAGGFALAVVLGLPVDEALVPAFAPLVAVYSVGVHSDVRGLIAAAAIGFAAFSVAVATDPDGQISDLVLSAGAMLAALAVGRAVRTMGFETDTLEARAAELERERDEKARTAVAAERARIARELHDVIGHSISVMGIQAGAVRSVLAPELQREREALLAVERTGRDAVTEMRRLLGFLRSDEDEGFAHRAAAHPQARRRPRRRDAPRGSRHRPARRGRVGRPLGWPGPGRLSHPAGSVHERA